MKKSLTAIWLILALLCLCACGQGRTDGRSGTDGASASHGAASGADGTNTDLTEQEDEKVDAENRSILAKALGVEETDRSMRFLLNALRTVGAGQIRSAEAGEENGQRLLDVLAEDGTEYRIYLTSGGGVDAVKNCSTGEWPLRSDR